MDITWLSAFWMGIISACSLPLGSLLTLVWRPAEREIAFFMAFGGGALLAALTIDLVATTLDEGHFHALALGSIGGGLLFIGLNEVVNDFGGFLRKSSTKLYHLRQQEYKQFKQVLSAVHRFDIFDALSDRDVKSLVASIDNCELNKGTLLYRRNDPPDHLYIVAEGTVELIDPTGDLQSLLFDKHDAFGWLAFLTGTPYRFNARAQTDVSVWRLSRTAFMHLIPNSATLLQAVHRELRSPRVSEYLLNQHGLSKQQQQHWCDTAVQNLMKKGTYPEAIPVERRSEKFIEHSERIQRLPLFSDLSLEAVKLIASKLIYQFHDRGETFFHLEEPADRMYIIDSGEVSMLDNMHTGHHAIRLQDDHAFGFMAFLTGGRHTVATLATEDTGVWVLRRQDFWELVHQLPELASRLEDFIQQPEISRYLREQQQLNPDMAARWCRQSIERLHNRTVFPAVSDMVFDIKHHSANPLAIWLGLLLDGIPEALVIGANYSVSHVGLSLLAGLFLSNFPEALSSSVGMRQHGMQTRIILLMWFSLMFLTGLISLLGSIFFVGLTPSVLAFTEGVAAGSMLTMIAQTMLPEAYIKGGSIVGFSTLLGFLSAIFFKTLE